MSSRLSRQQLAATALVGSGFSRWSRQRTRGAVAVLTYHGLRGGSASGLLDWSLQDPLATFHAVCAHLAEHYRVVTASEAAALVDSSERNDDRRPRVLLTFDDGYASNLKLALPVLREFDLPAVVFVSTAFVDGELLWFQKLDLALSRTRGERLTLNLGGRPCDWPLGTREERRRALGELLAALKALPWRSLLENVERIVVLLGADIEHGRPEPLEALAWDELRHLAGDGRFEIGAHTHRHPVLARCTDAEAREEIQLSVGRLREELGREIRWFAYPNGGPGDYDAAKCAGWLAEAGCEAAFSMIHGQLGPGSARWELPRYGAPASVREAEATVSGAFETLKQWRRQFRLRAAL